MIKIIKFLDLCDKCQTLLSRGALCPDNKKLQCVQYDTCRQCRIDNEITIKEYNNILCSRCKNIKGGIKYKMRKDIWNFSFTLPTGDKNINIPIYFNGELVGKGTTENGICYCKFNDNVADHIAKQVLSDTKQISLEINEGRNKRNEKE